MGLKSPPSALTPFWYPSAIHLTSSLLTPAQRRGKKSFPRLPPSYRRRKVTELYASQTVTLKQKLTLSSSAPATYTLTPTSPPSNPHPKPLMACVHSMSIDMFSTLHVRRSPSSACYKGSFPSQLLNRKPPLSRECGTTGIAFPVALRWTVGRQERLLRKEPGGDSTSSVSHRTRITLMKCMHGAYEQSPEWRAKSYHPFGGARRGGPGEGFRP